jgi:predicted MPP superfamily phosphohydrolase
VVIRDEPERVPAPVIFHASDLHIGAHEPDRLTSFQSLCAEQNPDLVILSGDLTDGGRRAEYQALGQYIAGFKPPVFIVPGNHDAPVAQLILRVVSPFSRFDKLPATRKVFHGTGFSVAELRTAAPIQSRLDWSKGVATPTRVQSALSALGSGTDGLPAQKRWRILVSHHPLVPGDVVGGVAAVTRCVEAGVDLMLSGHTHQSWFGHLGATPMLMSTAPTLASPRLRGETQGFHAYRLGPDKITCSVWRWSEHGFEAGAPLT